MSGIRYTHVSVVTTVIASALVVAVSIYHTMSIKKAIDDVSRDIEIKTTKMTDVILKNR